MAKSRREKMAEFERAEARCWIEFKEALAAARTAVDALVLVYKAPPESSPGRRFYSNLGFFMQRFTMPYGATREERLLYGELMRRMDASGSLKPSVLNTFERENPAD